jgi:hypothetical protein
MKKTILQFTLICVAALLFFSCPKEKNVPDSGSYISFKMDGVQKNFKAKSVAVKVAQGEFNSIGFTAFQDTTSAEFVYIQVTQKNKPISTGTYVDPGPNSEDLLVIAGYMPANQDPVKTYAAGLQEDNNPRLQVTITGLTTENVTGTFSGTFYDNGGDGPGISAVTEGKFSLPLY